MKSKNGITLIALVITIVVLIILAGVAINLTLGENGIFKRAEEAKQKESESSARERLELVLVYARIEKETNSSYNSEDYLTEMLEEENITVNGDSVIVDNYNFIIDRENLVILESLGETQIKVTAEVQEYLGKNENDKYAVSMLIVIESNTGLQSVVIQNPDGTTFELTTEQVKLGKDMEVEFDEEYILTVTTKDGTTETRKIVEKSIENIRTAEELAVFRDKVNTGLTYEGKTINVVNDLNLSSVCSEDIGSWEPIGNYGTDNTHIFKGTFNGNYNTIDNLYIDTTNSYQGLFGYVEDATIEGVIIDENSVITADSYVGGICGYIKNTKISNCANKTEITSINNVGGIVGRSVDSEIKGTYNEGNITGESYQVGGIVGSARFNSTTTNQILYSYNIGNILGGYQVGGIVGLGGGYIKIYNSYNLGNIKSTTVDADGINTCVGGIAGTLLCKRKCFVLL